VWIDAPTVARRGNAVRASARVRWEGPTRGPAEMWFETDAAFGRDLEPAPEAFLLAAMPLAAALAEPRLAIDGPVCARLLAGLEASMDLLARWYPWCRRVPVDATGGAVPLPPLAERRTGAFVSGGVDSLAMLAADREGALGGGTSPIRDAIFLFGWNSFDLDAGAPRPERVRAYEEQGARLRRLGEAAGFEVVPVSTNVRAFHPSYGFSKDVGFGAGMISAAHLFRRRITDAWFASHGHGPAPRPHGSHPALDVHHSSGAVEVRLAQPAASRMEKLRAVAAWPEALAALQVCLQFEVLPEGRVNCGACEKCRRTALGLLALGRLDAATTFPRTEGAREMAAAYRPSGARQFVFSSEVAEALARAGRADLARLVRGRISRAAWRERRRRLRRAIATLAGRPWAPPWSPRG
jgi:hypothetical protein